MSGANQRLLPANINLLQPGSNWFRLMDALNMFQQVNSGTNQQITALADELAAIQGLESTLATQVSVLQGQVSSLQSQVSSLQGQVSTLQGNISNLQGQIDTINQRLSNFGVP